MSYFCSVLKKTVIGEPLHKKVVQTREKVYKDEEGNEIGKGFETVKEVNVCAEGLKILESQEVKPE